MHKQYTVALTTISRVKTDGGSLLLDGPYASFEHFRSGRVAAPAVFYGEQVATWNDSLSLPLLPTEQSVGVFLKLRRSPRLDLDDGVSWRARPQTELHATSDKEWMDLESKSCPRGLWPVFKGESFDLWTPDTGELLRVG